MRDHPLHRLLERVNGARRIASPTAKDGERVLESAFQCSMRLAVYGTLAPGEMNAHVLAECAGTWSNGGVHGRRGVRNYPVFSPDMQARQVTVQVLHSDHLPAHWARIDEFEGPEYCRVLVPVFEGARLLTIANLYEARDPVLP